MYLFLSVEGQNCTKIGLSQILAEIQNKLTIISSNYDKDNSVYGLEFREISIIPTCVDDQMWEMLGWKERIFISRKKKEADIRLRINYEEFLHSDEKRKREIFINVIIDSIRAIQKKSKEDFNGQALIADILQATTERPIT